MDATTDRLHRLLARLARRTGYSFATEIAIGRMIDRSDRTVRRHLRQLVAIGAIRIERPTHNGANRIVVVSMPDRVRWNGRCSAPIASAPSRETLRAYPRTNNSAAPIAPPPIAEPSPPIAAADVLPVVEKLAAKGVALRVAMQLAAEHPADAIEAQLLALEHRKPRDVAATLVAAIRENWKRPTSLLDVLDRKQRAADREAAELQRREREAADEAARVRDRETAAQRLAQLDPAGRRLMEERARRDIDRKSVV